MKEHVYQIEIDGWQGQGEYTYRTYCIADALDRAAWDIGYEDYRQMVNTSEKFFTTKVTEIPMTESEPVEEKPVKYEPTLDMFPFDTFEENEEQKAEREALNGEFSTGQKWRLSLVAPNAKCYIDGERCDLVPPYFKKLVEKDGEHYIPIALNGKNYAIKCEGKLAELWQRAVASNRAVALDTALIVKPYGKIVDCAGMKCGQLTIDGMFYANEIRFSYDAISLLRELLQHKQGSLERPNRSLNALILEAEKIINSIETLNSENSLTSILEPDDDDDDDE